MPGRQRQVAEVDDRPRFRLGLVVGKFSPLHQGHEYLIEHARRQCRQVLLLSWSVPELAGCDARRRQRWLRQRFPGLLCVVLDERRLERLCQQRGQAPRRLPVNSASDQEQQAFTAWLCADLLGLALDAVFSSEAYGAPLAARLAAHTGKAVTAVEVDRQRRRYPISASAIRADPTLAPHWLAPEVRADLVCRVAVLGGESSGKTTLAAALAQRLGCSWVPEYGRELWEQRGGRLDMADLQQIARVQQQREDTLAADGGRWLVCDTTALTTLGYAGWLFAASTPGLRRRAAQRRYAHLLLCAPDFVFVQDGTRQDAGFRARQHAWYVQELTRRRLPWTLLEGPLAQRLAHACSVLGA